TEIIPEDLEPKLTLDTPAVMLTAGETRQLAATYIDELNVNRSELIQWQSTDPAVATLSATGLATGKAPGQAWAMATAPGNLVDSVLLTVVQNDNSAVARVEIVNAPSVLSTGNTVVLQARVYNAANQELSGHTIAWSSSNNTVLSINAAGVATALNAGTASVTATAGGINSLPAPVQVQPPGGLSRSGTFAGNSGYNVAGTATLQQNGDNLTLTLGSDFVSGNGPMLGVYLAKNASGGLNSQNSLKLGNLQKTSGMQVYAVPAGAKLNDYGYAVIYCIPFNVRFGTAMLN
ncbi:MAG TPA: DM13 domain-containing protein, partial [Saprospiraceae bacterium]|nr:DM13 domain-containing protein [Saprospiraceae bacterium]